MDNKLFWFWFTSIIGFSAKKQHQLMEMFYHPSELFGIRGDIIQQFLSDAEYQRFLKYREPVKIQRAFEKVHRVQAEYILYNEAAYPKRLKEIYDFPYGIFKKGRSYKERDLVVAIVGSRHPTAYGFEMASRLSKGLAAQGIGIISGLAKGIDGAAHRAVLESSGCTAGVLGCGIDRIYPMDNHQLFYQMYQEQTVFSEYGPGVSPMPYFFPARNRIISGLSDGILVVEARKKSGSLITADCGLEQNKEIFAVPGPVTDAKYEGCHGLIKQGAKLVEGIEDILSEFPKFIECSDNIRQFPWKCLADREKKVYDVVDLHPKHVNEIIYLTKLSFQEVVEALFHLEEKGHVKQLHHNIYIKKS